MPRKYRLLALLLIATPLLLACDSFDEEMAVGQIRERFCDEWAYGCTDSTEFEVDDVEKGPNDSRLVDFRVREGSVESDVLSSAYFQPAGDSWRLALFDDPLGSVIEEHAGKVSADRKRLTDQLLDLRSAQNWYQSIYNQYARSFEDLSRVNYELPGDHLTMEVSESGSWQATAAGRFLQCELGSGAYLPQCVVRLGNEPGARVRPLDEAMSVE